MIVGIDASRNRSGGAIAHIVGILSSFQPERYGIQQVHLWSYQSLLDQVPDHQWLVKHSTTHLEGSLFSQLWGQALILKNELKMFKCDILFATAASTLCRFSPMVVLSQDMLSYENGVMRYFGLSLIRLRLLAILFIQNLAFRRAAGVMFLTRYAGELIQRSCGVLENVAYVPHGVDEAFNSVRHIGAKSGDKDQSLRCLYVSPVWEFKHQWVVVRAIATLRERKPSPTGVVSGPLIDTRYFLIASNVSWGSQLCSPYSLTAFSPANTSIQAIARLPPYAIFTAESTTCRITGVTSIPIPSPSI